MGALKAGRRLLAALDAVRGRDAVLRAIREDGSTPARQAALLLAEARVKLALSRLKGREHWRLRELVRGDGKPR